MSRPVDVGIEREALEGQVVRDTHARQVGGYVAAVVLEQQAVPLAQLVVVQVQARVVLEMRRTQQLALGRVCPAVQRAHDVATRVAFALALQRAATLEHDRLAVTADVGDQLDAALRVAHQRAALRLLRQGKVVALVRHSQLMADVARAGLEDEPLLTL